MHVVLTEIETALLGSVQQPKFVDSHPKHLVLLLVDSGALGSWEEQREFGIESA